MTGNWKAAGAAAHRAGALDATTDLFHQTMPRIERAEKEAAEISKLEKAISSAPESVDL